MRPRSLLACALLLVGGCVTRNPRPEAPENPKYTFPHSTHVEAGLSCRTCHEAITTATAIGATTHVSLPSGEAAQVCLQCHEGGPPSVPPRRRERTINFSHAEHLPYVNGQCARCHTALVEPDDVKAPVPPMSVCTACHNHALDYAQARCQPCHVDLKRFPLKPVADFKHQADFLRTHGQMAKGQVATCAACHEQTSCAECHAAATRPLKPDIQWPEKTQASFIHRGDYVSRHTIDAAADPTSCRRCHGSAYCEACHTQQGVSPRTVLSPTSNPHPAGWNAGAVHGLAARQNIVSCAGCHDEGARSTCVTCHRNVNPHPVGWAQRHNKTSDVANNSMCRTCHTR